MVPDPDPDPDPGPDLDLGSRRAVVTGAAKGLGRHVASHLVAAGMTVTLLDVDPAVGEVAAGLGADAIVVDLEHPDETTAALRAAQDRGPFWLLVNNAGVFLKAPLLETSIDQWDRVQRINTRSMLITIQALAPGMVAAGGGRIVNLASMAAKQGTPGEAAYAASKSAVVALTRIASMELGASGITVNAVCPGYVLTDLGADTRTEHDVATWTAMSPLGRLADPADVASMIGFLASDEAGYITGQALNVTGGMCTW